MSWVTSVCSRDSFSNPVHYDQSPRSDFYRLPQSTTLPSSFQLGKSTARVSVEMEGEEWVDKSILLASSLHAFSPPPLHDTSTGHVPLLKMTISSDSLHTITHSWFQWPPFFFPFRPRVLHSRLLLAWVLHYICGLPTPCPDICILLFF